MFAKLYGTDENQVLVTIDEGYDGPEVRFYCKPEGLGVCSVAAQYEDSDEGWDKAEAYFAGVDESAARKIQNGILEKILSPNA